MGPWVPLQLCRLDISIGVYDDMFGLNERVFVHIDAKGTGLGNGGFVMLTQFANALAGLGYRVSVFDHQNRLSWHQFDWLGLSSTDFSISSIDDVLASREGLIVSSWITPLLPIFERRISEPDGQDFLQRIRYWCQEELLTKWAGPARAFCRRLGKIAINNGTLEQYYRAFGFNRVIHLWNWVRSDIFTYNGEQKVINTVGIQPDWDMFASRFLAQVLEPGALILCTGSQPQVAARMLLSDFFVFWNRDHLGLFTGETIGMSLYEAMACGCVPVAIEHDGNKYLKGIVPLFDSLTDAVMAIKELMIDIPRKEEIRFACFEFINKKFRFDQSRIEAIQEWFDYDV